MRNALRHREVVFVWGLAAVMALPRPVAAFQTGAEAGDSLQAWVWLDRGEEPVVSPGEEIRVYYRVSADAHVAIFRVDTEGRVSMIFPQHPEADGWTEAGTDHRLLLADSRTWDVVDEPGEGAFFLVASREPFDFSLLDFDDVRGWDLSAAGAEAYDDTYQAIDDHVLAILPSWETAEYALDLLPYEVAEAGSLSRPSDVVVLRSGRRVTYVPPARRVEYVSVGTGPHVRLFVRFGPLPRTRVRVHYGPPPLWRRLYWAPPPRPAPYPRYAPRPRYAPPPAYAPPRYAPPAKPYRPERPVRPAPAPRRPTATRPAPAPTPPSRPVVTRRTDKPDPPKREARPPRNGTRGPAASPARGTPERVAPARTTPERAVPARTAPGRAPAVRRAPRRGGSGSSPEA